MLSFPTILNKIDEKVVPPPSPKIKDVKMARFGFCAASALIWGRGGWGFAVPFYSVQDCRLDRLYQVKLEAEAFANESAWTARANQENTLQQPQVVVFYLYDNRSR